MICTILWQWCLCIYNEQISREILSSKPCLSSHRDPIWGAWLAQVSRACDFWPWGWKFKLHIGHRDYFLYYYGSTSHQLSSSSLLLCSLEGWTLLAASPIHLVGAGFPLSLARPIGREQGMGGEGCGIFILGPFLVRDHCPVIIAFLHDHPGETGQPYYLHIPCCLRAPETLPPPLVPSSIRNARAFCCYWSRCLT